MHDREICLKERRTKKLGEAEQAIERLASESNRIARIVDDLAEQRLHEVIVAEELDVIHRKLI